MCDCVGSSLFQLQEEIPWADSKRGASRQNLRQACHHGQWPYGEDKFQLHETPTRENAAE